MCNVPFVRKCYEYGNSLFIPQVKSTLAVNVIFGFRKHFNVFIDGQVLVPPASTTIQNLWLRENIG